jgi:hypothetical protein
MMGGTSYGWMMGSSGYRWMTGGRDAPAWMRGHALPGFMMGASGDAGKVMGALFAGAPGPRVSAAAAARLGSTVPAGATVNRAAREITFSGTTARITAVLACLHRGRALVSGQPDISGHAPGHAGLHCRHCRALQLPVPGPWARPERHDRIIHRQLT